MAAAGWTAAAAAQASRTCELAVAAWAGARVELSTARREYRSCLRQQRTACTAQEGRAKVAEQQLRLARNYLEGYCLR